MKCKECEFWKQIPDYEYDLYIDRENWEDKDDRRI